MASVLTLILGNRVVITTTFTDATGNPLSPDHAVFTARREGTADLSPAPTATPLSAGVFETIFYPDVTGHWYWRIEGQDASDVVVAADEGVFDVVSNF